MGIQNQKNRVKRHTVLNRQKREREREREIDFCRYQEGDFS